MSRRSDARLLAAERDAAAADARNLVLELVGQIPPGYIDPMDADVANLDGGEIIRRQVFMALSLPDVGVSQVLVTNRRLMIRPGGGSLVSLWWSGLAGFSFSLSDERVWFDFGDGNLQVLDGVAAPILAVVGVFELYGRKGLVRHTGLTALRY